MGSGRQWMSWIALDDAVAATTFLLNGDGPGGPVNLCAPQTVTNLDFTRALAAQLREWGAHIPVELPLGVLRVFLSCWVRLYGLICMEIFGHLKFALADAGPLSENELRQLGDLLGIADQYVPAGPA